MAARYERKSIMITANRPFSGRDDVFPDKAIGSAAIDRLVHHATIFERNVVSYRRRAAYDAAVSLNDIEPAMTLGDIENETKHPNREEDTVTPKDQIKP